MKKIVLILSAIIFTIASNLSCQAVENVLHTITLEKNLDGYNVLLDADSLTTVTKKSPSNNELMLEISNVVSDSNVNALYKGVSNVDSLVVENGNDKIKVYIKADNIKNSTVIIEPKDGMPTIVGETAPIDKILWVLCVLAMLSILFKVATKLSVKEKQVMIKKDIKDREIQLYKKYLNEMNTTNPIINRKITRKIDRRIDERLTRF